MADKTQIAIVDDHGIFRDGLKLLINSQANYNVCWQAGECQFLTAKIRDCEPDLIIMDYHMPGGDTGATISYLKKRYPKLKVVILTAATSGVLLQQLLKLHPDGLLLKESAGQVLLDSIHGVLNNKQIVAEPVREMVIQDNFSLTKREFQVLH